MKGTAMNGNGFALTLAALLLAAGCAGPDPMEKGDPEYAALELSARQAFDGGQVERAAGLYGRALQRARAMDDALSLGDAAYNLAACYLALGDGGRAAALLEEAEAELRRGGRSPADALLLGAEAALLRESRADAASFCDEVLALPGGSAGDGHRAHACMVLARLARDAGDLPVARGRLAEAVDHISDADDPSLLARAAGFEAVLFLDEGSPADAAGAFDREAGYFQDAGRFGEMAGALERAGAAYREAGDAGRAADRFYRSARSSLGQGNGPAARRAAGAALAAARAAGDAGLARRIELLLE